MFNQFNRLKEYTTYLLLTFVSVSSWVDINAIFAELSQIVLTQPEGWKLGAHLGLVINIGNIAPFALVIFKCIFGKHRLNLILLNYIVIIIGMMSCILLVFFWSNTVYILRENRSVSLFILSFFLSLVDCTSMVTLSDYMTHFQTKFTSTLFLGESLSMILPSFLAIAQGNGQLECISIFDNNKTSNFSTIAIYKTARFSVSIYFLCIFFLLLISFISLMFLQWTKVSKNFRQVLANESSLSDVNELDTIQAIETSNNSEKSNEYILTTTSYYLLLLGCLYATLVIFGLLLSVSTYVLMPYGHQIFYLGTILSPWMLSIVSFFGVKKPLVGKRYLLIMLLLGSVTFSFDVFLCFKSPCPPFANTIKGSILVLFIWLSTYILIGYPRLVMANYLRIHSPNGMFWFGVSNQVGAFIGSVAAYLLVETFSQFKEKLPCESLQC
ncbi:unnamed protein product [Rotaria sp. Silwood1]|nr:unnamed protein product [Rotaria sp. Silwood1]